MLLEKKGKIEKEKVALDSRQAFMNRVGACGVGVCKVGACKFDF